jgi:hypothetical protein
MNSLTSLGITFKQVEEIFFEIGCEVAGRLMENFLEGADKELADERNKAELRHKGNRTTTIKTLMGEVTVKRTLYRRVTEEGRVEHIYLLDEALGFDTIGNISPNLVEKIAGHVSEISYRGVAEAVSELTNQSISHQGVWNVVQAVGERQAEAEKRLVKAFEKNELNGKKEIPVLFEEADGLWLSMQGKSRKGASKGKKEMKTGVMYEGWEKRYPSSKEYRTIEKTAFAGYMNPEEFKALRDSAAAEKYNLDEIQYRILNGDGAAWIRKGHDSETDIFQLDPYHLAKSVVRNVKDKNAGWHMMKWLKTGEFDKVFGKIRELKYASEGVESEIKKLSILEEYIRGNIDGIVNYKGRETVEMPEPPAGIEYRNMGTMEKNVDIFAVRMKGSKSWSEQGATNLSKIIALKMGKGFNDKVAALISGKLSERLEERFEEAIKNARKEIHKAVRKSVYPMHHGEIPFNNCKVTNGRKAIRSMFDLKPFSEMAYI